MLAASFIFMRLLLFILFILTFGNTSGQKSVPILYDTTDQIFKFIDLSKIDTVSLWNYELDLEWKGYKNDTIAPPMGRLSFFREKPIVNFWDQIRQPYLRYNIYYVDDSLTANKESKYIKRISSCFPLQGGEKLLVGNFIFVNSDVCSGDIDKNKNEICRPLVNYVMGLVDKTKTNSIQELVDQLQLKKGVLRF